MADLPCGRVWTRSARLTVAPSQPPPNRSCAWGGNALAGRLGAPFRTTPLCEKAIAHGTAPVEKRLWGNR
eukprot:5563835-Alexandrium_andersonii.AAC.1